MLASASSEIEEPKTLGLSIYAKGQLGSEPKGIPAFQLLDCVNFFPTSMLRNSVLAASRFVPTVSRRSRSPLDTLF